VQLTIIRASSLSGYADCPRRAAARLFRREIEAAGYRLAAAGRGIGAVIGHAVHKAARVTLEEKARSGSLPPVDIATDAALETLTEELRDGPIEYDGARGATHNKRDAEAQSVVMARSYHRVIAPQVQPVLVEERLEAEVEPGLVLSGQADVIAREPGSVRDLKTGVRKPSGVSPQLGGYALLGRSNGLVIETCSIDFVQRVHVRKPQPDPVTTSVPIAPAETAAVNILRAMARDPDVFRHGDAERRIMPGDPWAFMPNPSSVLCGPKYCPAFGTEFCHEGDANE
jgi:hypothetical protein